MPPMIITKRNWVQLGATALIFCASLCILSGIGGLFAGDTTGLSLYTLALGLMTLTVAICLLVRARHMPDS
jgi:uncharacterized membrane protein